MAGGRPSKVRCSLPDTLEAFMELRLPLDWSAATFEVNQLLTLGRLTMAREERRYWILELTQVFDPDAFWDVMPLLDGPDLPLPDQNTPDGWRRLCQSVEALTALQSAIRSMRTDVYRSGIYAEISERHLPELLELGARYRVTERAPFNPSSVPDSLLQRMSPAARALYSVVRDLRQKSGPPGYSFVTGSTHEGKRIRIEIKPYQRASETLRIPLAEELPRPFSLLFGWVWYDAYQWLGERVDRRCRTCGKPLPEEASLKRRYCGEACKSAYRRRK